MQQTPRLRYALLLNGPGLQAWEAQVLSHLEKLDPSPELCFIIYRQEMAEYSPIKTSWWTRFRKINFSQLGYHYFQRFLNKSRALEIQDYSEKFSQIPSLTTETLKKGKWSEYFDDISLDALSKAKPDFILRFGFNIIKGEILTLPKYGVWSFHHGDEEKYRGSPPAFWEIYKGDPVTGAILQRLTESLDSGIILKKGFFQTLSHSYADNLDQVLLESSSWPAQICKALIAGAAFPSSTEQSSAPIYRAPTNLQLLFFGLRIFFNRLKKRITNWLTSERWDVGLLPRPIEEALGENFLSNCFDLGLSNPKNFYADPFGVQDNNGIRILAEKYNYGTGQGDLCTLTISSNARAEKSLSGFPNREHLSYPYLFWENGKSYCVPESLAQNEISLFEAVEFPENWKKVATLIKDFPGVDATLFVHNKKYWIFCTNESDGPRHNLYLFHSEHLTGPYQPHFANPVKTDIRSSRPAGTPFVVNGRLYRPAQDCSKTYGGAIVLNEVLHLSETEFSEKPVKSLGPLPGTSFSKGMHTISRCGNYTLVDGKSHRFNPYAFIRVLKLRFG